MGFELKIEKGVNYQPLQEFIEHILEDVDFSDFMDRHYSAKEKQRYYEKLSKQLVDIKSAMRVDTQD